MVDSTGRTTTSPTCTKPSSSSGVHCTLCESSKNLGVTLLTELSLVRTSLPTLTGASLVSDRDI